ncbi:TIGR04222 domain-containing membrane protein [Nonomuraea sp. SYSU D8015]|uniref:TIGR04222 domain-containing membrane protein n=1 Tax=Nonomuraea sp. SYSU D8015 TaxID=2593644 RepID=UPI0016601CD9|nr:TIGR04222 domain-containing membrane protein [Nonomuraea sp. SYSU D8015]
MDFILLLAGMGMLFLVSMIEQSVGKARRKVSEVPPSGVPHRLDSYELAYLSGGPRRTINTALAVLATAGAIRVSRGSHVTPVHGAPPSPVPIERAVLTALAARPGGYRAAELRRALQTHPALTDLASGLEGRGLIMRQHAFAAAWKRRELLQVAGILAVGFLVLLVALVVIGEANIALGWVGAMVFGLVAVISAFAGYAKHGRLLRNVVTREGREVLRSARLYHPRGVRNQSSLSMAVGVPVALYGLADVGDPMLCDELSAGDPGGDCAGACGTYSGGGESYGGSDFGGGDSYGGSDFGSGSSSCGGGSSSSCSSSSSSSCGGGGGSSCGSSS